MAEPARNISRAQPHRRPRDRRARAARRSPSRANMARRWSSRSCWPSSSAHSSYKRTRFRRARWNRRCSSATTYWSTRLSTGSGCRTRFSASRSPACRLGQYVFHLAPVHRGDVVVFVFPPDRSKDFIKRVSRSRRRHVAVKNGVVWLNGAEMPDPHRALGGRRARSLSRLAARQLRSRDRAARQAVHDGR